ncbi:hypothetical protein [Porphyromonas gulae]|uniref:Uncharacterized protein n=1 Tax=Porphyromonas gulae TaxID=111105 RepID=A0A0A2F3I0_9PORP|nr:hypothetical protein [Porphyromonas gulae]KGN85586.1 hypothetical protein HR15_09605 [Porphyromonas gulae]
MKEGFDLSHYLNVGKGNQEKQSEQSQPSEPAKLSSTSEQTLPSESLHEEKDNLKAEQSKQEREGTSDTKHSKTYQPEAT